MHERKGGQGSLAVCVCTYTLYIGACVIWEQESGLKGGQGRNGYVMYGSVQKEKRVFVDMHTEH